MEQRWVTRLAQFNYKICYKPGRNNGHADALTRYLVEHTGEDLALSHENMEVAPVLPVAASPCSLKRQAAAPQVETTEIHIQKEWALIQQKDPELMHCNTSCHDGASHPPKNVGYSEGDPETVGSAPDLGAMCFIVRHPYRTAYYKLWSTGRTVFRSVKYCMP